MQLAWTTIEAWTIVVEDAIGEVGRLLNLGKEDATAYGMDSACREIEDVATFYFVVIWKKRVRRLPRLRSILSI